MHDIVAVDIHTVGGHRDKGLAHGGERAVLVDQTRRPASRLVASSGSVVCWPDENARDVGAVVFEEPVETARAPIARGAVVAKGEAGTRRTKLSREPQAGSGVVWRPIRGLNFLLCRVLGEQELGVSEKSRPPGRAPGAVPRGKGGFSLDVKVSRKRVVLVVEHAVLGIVLVNRPLCDQLEVAPKVHAHLQELDVPFQGAAASLSCCRGDLQVQCVDHWLENVLVKVGRFRGILLVDSPGLVEQGHASDGNREDVAAGVDQGNELLDGAHARAVVRTARVARQRRFPEVAPAVCSRHEWPVCNGVLVLGLSVEASEHGYELDGIDVHVVHFGLCHRYHVVVVEHACRAVEALEVQV